MSCSTGTSYSKAGLAPPEGWFESCEASFAMRWANLAKGGRLRRVRGTLAECGHVHARVSREPIRGRAPSAGSEARLRSPRQCDVVDRPAAALHARGSSQGHGGAGRTTPPSRHRNVRSAQQSALIDISAPWWRQIRSLPSPSPAAKPTAVRALRPGSGNSGA
jgi:hypothetical protein